MLPNYGKDERKFSFWYNSDTEKMLFMETLKVTFTCNFDFAYFPFDSHHCDFDFGILGYSNLSVIFAPVQVLTPESTKPKLLENEIVIPNIHLPYSFTMTSKELYEVPHVGYSSPHIGVTINIKREKLDQLIGGFYIPMTIFAFLSMISFFINPEAVSYI